MSVIPADTADSNIYDTFSVRDRAPAVYEEEFFPSGWLTSSGFMRFLEKYSLDINAPELDMTAAFWANRYSRFFAFIHYALAKGYDLDASLNNITLYHVTHSSSDEPAFEFVCSYKEEGTLLDQETRQKALLNFYQNHVVPLFQKAARLAGIRTRELWGQVYHAVPYFMGLSKITETAGLQERMNEDWRFLTEETSSADFQEKKHPLQFKCIAIPNPVDEKPMYTKPTCCLAFKRSGQCCYRCPRMKPDERNRRLQK